MAALGIKNAEQMLELGKTRISRQKLSDKTGIALNRWWLEGGFQAYLGSLTLMLVGFTLFVILISQTKTEFIGYIFLVIAIYFVCNYEIGGPSKYYLTPFDPYST